MIAIYGPGETTEEVLSRFEIKPARVFSTQGGGFFGDLPIQPIESLDNSITQLIIVTSYYPQIVVRLLDRGFPIDRVSIQYHDGLDNFVEVDPNDLIPHYARIKENERLSSELVKLYPGFDNPNTVDRDNFRVESVRLPSISGMNLEFGTYKGESIRTFSPFVSKIYGFDTFDGLPEDWTLSRPRGSLNSSGLPNVPANCSLIKGQFQDTLPEFLRTNLEAVRFAFIDCDLFESTEFVLKEIDDRLVVGSVILFDEWVPLPEDFDAGEYYAWQAFVENSNSIFAFDARCGNAVRFICIGKK